MLQNFGKVEEEEETMLDEAWLKEKEDCLNLLIEESADGEVVAHDAMEVIFTFYYFKSFITLLNFLTNTFDYDMMQ